MDLADTLGVEVGQFVEWYLLFDFGTVGDRSMGGWLVLGLNWSIVMKPVLDGFNVDGNGEVEFAVRLFQIKGDATK